MTQMALSLTAGRPGCNPGLSQTTGNCQGKRTIQNNTSHLFVVRGDPCVVPPGRVRFCFTPQWKLVKRPDIFLPRKTQNTRKKRVSLDVIRAERSEQEVNATTFFSESGFRYSLSTAGQAGPWHTETFLNCIQFYGSVSTAIEPGINRLRDAQVISPAFLCPNVPC